MMEEACPFVSRGGIKLAAALDAFGVEAAGCVCADFGCHVGGFTDCLLQHGAAKVYAVDTAYGTLAWPLRQEERVVVCERTNVVHFDPQEITGFCGCDLITIDLGWTRQTHAMAAGLRWLKPGSTPRIITLIKPQYEAKETLVHQSKGVLDDGLAAATLDDVLAQMPQLGVKVIEHITSPIRGGGGKGRRGNIEYLALVVRA